MQAGSGPLGAGCCGAVLLRVLRAVRWDVHSPGGTLCYVTAMRRADWCHNAKL